MKKMSTLSNGLRVVTDCIDHVETVSLGAWFGIGARYEEESVNGISHVLEHMAFKGTNTRSALEIAETIENVGGYLNAYTSRETTAYYARLLKEHAPLGIEILGDILQNSAFSEEELKKEQQVILQEIGQTQDSPDDIVFDYFQETCFKDQSMGRSILGPASNVESFTNTQVKTYMQDHYSAKNMVFAAAGKIDHDAFVADVEKAFSGFKSDATVYKEPSVYTGGDFRQEKELEQVHVILGLEGVGYGHDHYYHQVLSSIVLGGGMSSRLFQEIREKRGLVYGISAYASPYTDTGIFSIYAGTGEEPVKELLPLTITELFKMTSTVKESELDRAKAQLKANLMMGLESTSNRSERLANQILVHNRFVEPSEIIQKIEAVHVHDIQSFMHNLLKGKPTLTTLGPIKNVMPYDDFYDLYRKTMGNNN
jgi:predicted Zn-dependent peptidase